MKRSYKGAFWIPLIIGIVLALVVVGVLIYAFGGKGFGGGMGDSEGSNFVPADVSISDSSQPETQAIEYMEITVSGSDYIFQNKKLTVNELIVKLNSLEEKMPVKITDDGASIKAYDVLINMLKENNIRYIEQEND